MVFRYEPCWKCKKRNIKSNRRMYCPYCGAEKKQERKDALSQRVCIALDCGKSDCEWYDAGKGYEECKWCSRFSKSISRETLKSQIIDRYSSKQAPAQAKDGEKRGLKDTYGWAVE